jgi:hypothetical protein
MAVLDLFNFTVEEGAILLLDTPNGELVVVTVVEVVLYMAFGEIGRVHSSIGSTPAAATFPNTLPVASILKPA